MGVLEAVGQRGAEVAEQREEARPRLHVVAVVRPELLDLVEPDLPVTVAVLAVAVVVVVVAVRSGGRRRPQEQRADNECERSPHGPPRSEMVQLSDTVADASQIPKARQSASDPEVTIPSSRHSLRTLPRASTVAARWAGLSEYASRTTARGMPYVRTTWRGGCIIRRAIT